MRAASQASPGVAASSASATTSCSLPANCLMCHPSLNSTRFRSAIAPADTATVSRMGTRARCARIASPTNRTAIVAFMVLSRPSGTSDSQCVKQVSPGRRDLRLGPHYLSTGTITYGIPFSRSGAIQPSPFSATASMKYISSHSGTMNEPGIVAAYLPLSGSRIMSTAS